MKILVVCQHYWPEPYPLADICEELVKRGHLVHVITGVPNYPIGYIYDDYKMRKNRKQEHNGVKITRTFTIGRRNNVLCRFLNYMSFAITSTYYAKKLSDEYDVVYMNQTSPVTMANAGIAYAKKWNKKAILYCMDLWPASLAAGGIKENSLIYKVFGVISKRIYRKSDKILITSQMFRKYLKEQFDIMDERIVYLPQYADSQFVAMEKSKQKKCEVNFVFAGNVGAAQCLDTVLKAAKVLNEKQLKEQIVWHIVGDGSELNRIKKLSKELALQNVVFHGRKPLNEMPKYYEMADAMVLTLTSDRYISMTLPRKVQSYMAAGKPILASANGEIADVINKSGCGFCAKAGDVDGFVKEVIDFLEYEEKSQLGENAKIYYQENFTKKMFMDKLEEELSNT